MDDAFENAHVGLAAQLRNRQLVAATSASIKDGRQGDGMRVVGRAIAGVRNAFEHRRVVDAEAARESAASARPTVAVQIRKRTLR